MPQETSLNSYLAGLKGGLPIGLGYLSVSFGFGISVVSKGLAEVWAVIISMTNLTSAGQLAGVSVIVAGGTLLEMVLTQLVINIRYSLMGIALTQKLDGNYSTGHRLVTSFGITDEIFAVAASQKGTIGPKYMYGLMTLPYACWTLGTVVGVLAGNILPASVTSALGIAIFSMFVAIVVPAAKTDKGILLTVILSCVLSCVLYYVPVFKMISQGFAIIICALAASIAVAIVLPVEQSEEALSDV